MKGDVQMGPRYNTGDDGVRFVPHPIDEETGAVIEVPVVVVTRHSAMLAWLERRGYPVYKWVDERDLGDGGWNRVKKAQWEILSHVTSPDQVRGKVVIGALPLSLAAEAFVVGAIDMPRLRSDQRGTELSVQEMFDAGATVRWYRVTELGKPTSGARRAPDGPDDE